MRAKLVHHLWRDDEPSWLTDSALGAVTNLSSLLGLMTNLLGSMTRPLGAVKNLSSLLGMMMSLLGSLTRLLGAVANSSSLLGVMTNLLGWHLLGWQRCLAGLEVYRVALLHKLLLAEQRGNVKLVPRRPRVLQSPAGRGESSRAQLSVAAVPAVVAVSRSSLFLAVPCPLVSHGLQDSSLLGVSASDRDMASIVVLMVVAANFWHCSPMINQDFHILT